MRVSLGDLTSVAAVQAALDEYESVGQGAFLASHFFGRASNFLVLNPRTGAWADSKAIAGVALGYQFPGSGGLQASDFSGGEATVQRKLMGLGFQVRKLSEVHGQPWTQQEDALIVEDYLAMLVQDLTGQRANKALHRRQLLSKLPGRSESAIEFKRANISAVMLEMGFPYLKGYQPRANFQRQFLMDEVVLQVARQPLLDAVALEAAQRHAVVPSAHDFTRVKTESPRRELLARESSPAYLRPPIKRDYFAREAQNRSLGLAGEEFAVRFERWRLIQLGADQLAEQVQHASVVEGDGLGYDIRSFDLDGQPRFIEVKTTAFGERTPFFVSANEVKFAQDHAERFRLYRLFDFRATPRLFELDGPIERHCQLDASTFRASFG